MLVKKNPVVDYPDDPEEILYKTRLEMAREAYIDSNSKLSIRKAATQHGIPQWERLRDRINGMKPKKKELESRQRLSLKEEQIIKWYIRQLKV